MTAQIDTAPIRPMMGAEVLESLPSRNIPYSLVDPYVRVHEATVAITPSGPSSMPRHSDRGFDNLWCAVSGALAAGKAVYSAADHQLVSLSLSLTTAEGHQGQIDAKARQVDARVRIEDDEF